MDVSTVLQTIKTISEVAKAAIDAGHDAAPFIEALYETFAGKSTVQITQDDLDELEVKVDRLADEFEKPMDPEA